jgi:hypothetical protein
MRRIRRMIFAGLASVSLLGGASGAALATATVTPTGVVAMVSHPTAVEY